VINESSRQLNFTNEAGANGSILLLKNIAGMWLLQECRRAWAAEGETFTYDELIRMAEAAGAVASLIDPDDFAQPGDMPARIAARCGARTKGQTCRVILESLARRYREVLDGLESLTGKAIRTIHIVGGGSRNALLNQLAASASGRTVIAGPAEATAAGNVLVQAMGAGEIAGAGEAREIVRRSFGIEVFEPR
jgi:rhamnulokinase